MAVWRFISFDCYRRHSLLVMRKWDGTANILHIKEVVPNGGSLAMVAYGIGFFPMIKRLKLAYPDITQPWYAEDDLALVMFDKLEIL